MVSHAEQPELSAAGAETEPRGRAAVRIWLYALCALVFAMVLVGGATRLTDSGLSITEWRPIMGIVPPLGVADWQEAFEKYRQIPEYQLINKGMSLEEFKVIFWWEWGHRFLGRMVGFAFLLPFLFFWATGRIERGLMPKLILMFVLGGLQGALGWYMVMSGLVDRVDVSQYRLAAHLSAAVLIFGYMFWVALGLGSRPAAGAHQAAGRGAFLSAVGLTALIFVQIALGAFVAGLDAGMGYTTWPLMDGRLIPEGLGAMTPWYLNLFENALTVQFDHRMMAYATLLWAVFHSVQIWRSAGEGPLAVGAGLLMVIVFAQVALGIWTLLAQVPISLGLAHQGVAMVLFAAALWHLHQLARARGKA